jgi:hypothetical protein
LTKRLSTVVQVYDAVLFLASIAQWRSFLESVIYDETAKVQSELQTSFALLKAIDNEPSAFSLKCCCLLDVECIGEVVFKLLCLNMQIEQLQLVFGYLPFSNKVRTTDYHFRDKVLCKFIV